MELRNNPRFQALNDKGRNYLDKETGLTISRRIAAKLNRGGVSNELLAKQNAGANKILQVSRPARGRSSLLKKSDTEKEFIAQARIEEEQRKREIAEQEKIEREKVRKRLRKDNKKVKKYKDTGRLLKPGNKSRRIPFDSYEEYVRYYDNAAASGKIRFYGLGVEGYHEDDPDKELTATVFTMSTFDGVIPKKEFIDAMDDAVEGWSYFVFTNYWIFLAYKIEYANKLRETTQARKRRK